MAFLYIKALHLIFVVTWFAGLFYAVRLFIYHTEALSKSEPDRTILSNQLGIMTKKLWFIITWPSAILATAFGVSLLVIQPSYLSQPYMHIKLAFVAGLLLYQIKCHQIFRQLQTGEAKHSSLWLRVFNEVATIILFAVVFLIILKNEINWLWGTLGLVSFAIILMMLIKLYKKIREK